MLRIEVHQLLVRAQLLFRETRRRRVAALERFRHISWSGARHVGVNAEQLRRRLDTHRLGDRRTPIAALRYKARVTEALHEHRPSAGGPGGIPPGGGGLAGESVAGQRGDHEMESV